MKHLLEKSMQHLDAAGRRWNDRDYGAARWQYLKSAEYLFKAAAQSDGPLREARLEKAEHLLDIARRLPGSSRLDRTAVAEPVAADEQQDNFLLRQAAEVRLDDVAGLEDAKQEIRLRLIYPLQYPEKAAHYGVHRGGGLLLYGPPGTGKTLLARAVAGEVEADFFTAKPSELMSKWVGESERKVAELFSEARQCERAIVFLDEVEALIPARKSSGSTVMQRVVPQILAELQGVRGGETSLLFLAATNEPWAIDPAALRPGRFDAKVYVGLPEPPARKQMLNMYLAHRPLGSDVNQNRLNEALEGYSGADIAEICDRTAGRVFIESIRQETDRPIMMKDFESIIPTVKPSISPAVVEKYRTWQNA